MRTANFISVTLLMTVAMTATTTDHRATTNFVMSAKTEHFAPGNIAPAKAGLAVFAASTETGNKTQYAPESAGKIAGEKKPDQPANTDTKVDGRATAGPESSEPKPSYAPVGMEKTLQDQLEKSVGKPPEQAPKEPPKEIPKEAPKEVLKEMPAPASAGQSTKKRPSPAPQYAPPQAAKTVQPSPNKANVLPAPEARPGNTVQGQYYPGRQQRAQTPVQAWPYWRPAPRYYPPAVDPGYGQWWGWRPPPWQQPYYQMPGARYRYPVPPYGYQYRYAPQPGYPPRWGLPGRTNRRSGG